MQLDELYLRLPPGKEREVIGRVQILHKHCLLLSGRHTIVDRTYYDVATAFSRSQKQTNKTNVSLLTEEMVQGEQNQNI